MEPTCEGIVLPTKKNDYIQREMNIKEGGNDHGPGRDSIFFVLVCCICVKLF
jgi:hypothetical protein